jgi:hypothetical protein
VQGALEIKRNEINRLREKSLIKICTICTIVSCVDNFFAIERVAKASGRLLLLSCSKKSEEIKISATDIRSTAFALRSAAMTSTAPVVPIQRKIGKEMRKIVKKGLSEKEPFEMCGGILRARGLEADRAE